MALADPVALSCVLDVEDLRTRGVAECVGTPPIVLEIGFGRSELLLDLAEKSAGTAHLGVEVSLKRVVKAARRVEKCGLRNVRLVHTAAERVLEEALPESCVGVCWINCPDPWPKRRHHKRRLIQAPLVAHLARVLVPGAPLHVSTDHEEYAAWIHDVLSREPELENLHAPEPVAFVPPERITTAYEAEWQALGRRLHYFDYRRRPPQFLPPLADPDATR